MVCKLERRRVLLTQMMVWVLQGPGDMDDWMPPPPEEDPSQMDLLPPADSNMPDEAASVGSAGGWAVGGAGTSSCGT
jgi:hypothetical protein